MTGERVSLFGQDADLDLTDFKPKAPAKPEQVRDVAEHAGFRSREPGPQPVAETPRAPRRYRTGRNIQLNLKVRREAVEAFYKLAAADRQMQTEHERLSAEHHALSQRLLSCQDRNEELELALRQARADAEEALTHVEALHASTSWRLTGPVRALRRLLP